MNQFRQLVTQPKRTSDCNLDVTREGESASFASRNAETDMLSPAGTKVTGSDRNTEPAVLGRILFIIDRLEVMGGAERALLEMTRHLPSIGYQCAVVTFASEGFADLADQFDCPTYVLPLRRSYGVRAFRCALMLRRIIQSFKPDIVQTFFETSDIWGSLVARLCGVSVIVSSRRDLGILRARKHRVLYRVLRRNFDLVLTVSNAVRKFCIEKDGIAPERVLTVYNSVAEPIRDFNGRAALCARHHLRADTRLVVTLANVRRLKGIDTLLETAALVCAQHPNVAFLVVGAILEPDYFAEISNHRLLKEIRTRFIFVGSSEPGGYLQSADVFCMLSRSEGFSNAVLEAMAGGLPLVITNVGGNSEAVTDGQQGFLVAVNDHRTAAARIVELLTDDSLRTRIGKSARERVRAQFSRDAMLRRLGEIYGGLMTSKGNIRELKCQPTY